jgi:hypothetical protein
VSLEFNVGELAQRVRRLLSVRGRMPLDLDERCSINVQSMDCGTAPWRSDGSEFSGNVGNNAQPGNVINAQFAVNGAGPVQTRAVVRQFIFSNRNAAPLCYLWQMIVDTAVKGNPVWQTEARASYQATALTYSALKWTTASNAAPVVSFGSATGGVVVPANSSIVVPVTIVIAGGYSLQIEQQTVNSEFFVTVQGETWNGEGFALS